MLLRKKLKLLNLKFKLLTLFTCCVRSCMTWPGPASLASSQHCALHLPTSRPTGLLLRSRCANYFLPLGPHVSWSLSVILVFPLFTWPTLFPQVFVSLGRPSLIPAADMPVLWFMTPPTSFGVASWLCYSFALLSEIWLWFMFPKQKHSWKAWIPNWVDWQGQWGLMCPFFWSSS